MRIMKVIAYLSWILVILGCATAVFVGAMGLSAASGAPQEAVVICLALACAIIPYCWARAWTEIHNLETKESKEKYNYQTLPK